MDMFIFSVISGMILYCNYTEENLKLALEEYPDAKVGTYDQFVEEVRGGMMTPLKEISKIEYDNKIRNSSPMHYVASGGVDMFKSTEMIFEDLTNIYIKVNGKCYSCVDSIKLSIREIHLKIDKL